MATAHVKEEEEKRSVETKAWTVGSAVTGNAFNHSLNKCPLFSPNEDRELEATERGTLSFLLFFLFLE